MTYSRVKHGEEEPDPDERCLAIIKNRLTGKLGDVYMYYSEDSKRIVGPDKKFNKCYIMPDLGMDVEINDEEMEIPFYADEN